MDEGGRGWEKLAPEERNKLRIGAQAAGTWGTAPEDADGSDGEDDYGVGGGSASR
jgi:hypothetical protein